MELKKKNYSSTDALRLAFEASPICMGLYAALPVTQFITQTAITALATANFTDTAISILNHSQSYQDIYPALAMVLLTLGLVNTIGAVTKLAASKVRVNLERCLKPTMVKILASFDYKHIENEKNWELISRVFRDPVKSIMDGVHASGREAKAAHLAEGKCALIVTHRMGSARLADRIVVMEAGDIVDIGTHDELIARPGPYTKMWQAQAQWYERA